MGFDLAFLSRKKVYDATNIHVTQLSRVLGFIDITALGVSCTLGNGIYVLAGDVIANYAGPSIVFSFIVAGLATFVSGICYAEFGSRVPRSGSAYVYIYVTIGEFVAFVLGWDLILEYVIGVSSGASALSRYIDSLCDNKIQEAFRSAMPIHIKNLAPYPDFLAFALVLLITVFMVVGVKESAAMNKLFTALNIIVIGFIVVVGAFKADIRNWQLKPESIESWIDEKGVNQTCATSPRCGKGGFFAYGFEGVMKGAAKCFYAFIGFDAICSTGEEVKNPNKNIPLSIMITLLVVSFCYCTSSVVLTLMIPFNIILPDIPIPQAFAYVGMHWAKYLVSIGAIASLATCLYASMFPMPRVVYSLASDGLIFRPLSYVSPRLKTPVTAAISSGLFAGILCLIFDLNQLIDMMSIGTLMAYSVVAICVVILRYRPDPSTQNFLMNDHDDYSNIDSKSKVSLAYLITKPPKVCCLSSSKLVNYLSILATLDVLCLSVTCRLFNEMNSVVAILLVSFFALILIVLSSLIWKQPQNENITTFKIPLVHILPFLSVFVNTYLMTLLSIFTWIRFSVWFVIGIIMYFTYGISHSSENKKKQNFN